MTGKWRLALRVATRLCRRAPGRSTLIALLIALPVFAGVAVIVTIRTYQLSPDQDAARLLGTATGVAQDTGLKQVSPDVVLSRERNPGPYMQTSVAQAATSNEQRAGTLDVTALLPPGVRAIPDAWARGSQLEHADKQATVEEIYLDLSDPLTHGTMQLHAGTFPSKPGEVAVTTHLAHRLNLRVGTAATLSELGTVTVAAVVRDPFSLSVDDVVAGPATYGPAASFLPGPGSDLRWLIESKPGADAGLHDALARHGVVYATRHDWAHPPSDVLPPSPVDPQVIAVTGAIAGFGLIEVILLAGAAFAVGVRRQVHDLGLLRVAGGDDRDVMRTILAQGVVLGAVGAVFGAALGVVAVFVGRPLLESAADRAFGPLDARPLELAAIIALGVLSAVAAAVVPARTTTRLAVVRMLKASFPYDPRDVRTPRWALLATPAGALVTAGAAWGWHHSAVHYAHAFAKFQKAIATHPGLFPPALPSYRKWAALLVLGAVITLAGLVRSYSPLLAHASRWADRLPLALRLAVRDAGRQRHRTAPAVAAVMTVLTGAVLVVFVMSSTDLRAKQHYTAQVPLGDALVSAAGSPTGAPPTMGTLRAVVDRVAHGLPTRFSGIWGTVNIPAHDASGVATDPGGYVMPHVAEGDCTPTIGNGGGGACELSVSQVAAADASFIDAIAGHHDARAAAALAAGHAVVLRSSFVHDGRVELDVNGPPGPDGTSQSSTMSLPAYLVAEPSYAELPQVIISPATAQTHGWSVDVAQGFISTTRVPTQAEVDRVNRALGNDAGIYVERGYHAHYGIALLMLAAAATLITFAGTSVSVALSIAESRADQATFAAVGASPSRRRRQAMAQAATISSVGAVLGVALGALVGVALLGGSSSYPLTLPWRWLAVVCLSAPLLSTLPAALFAGGKLPLTRRIA